jgi:hypothetical protein
MILVIIAAKAGGGKPENSELVHNTANGTTNHAAREMSTPCDMSLLPKILL